MAVSTADEEPRRLSEGQSEAVTIAFADAGAEICGVARVGRGMNGGELRASGLGILFASGEPVAVRAGASADEGELAAAGVQTETLDPLERWAVTFESEDGRHGFDLELDAQTAAAELAQHSAVAGLGGMAGYDQLVTVHGSVTLDGVDRRFDGRGTRSRSWGTPDWSQLHSARTIGVWFADGGGVSATTIRGRAMASHGDEAMHVVLNGPGGSEPVLVADPRISVTYDPDGQQRAAGLELYPYDDGEYPERIAGEVACGTTLELGSLTLQCAFFNWRSGQRTGVGRFDVVRATGSAPA